MIAVNRNGIMPEMGLAVYRGTEIPEIGAITDKNSLSLSTDIHFGINKNMNPVTTEPGCPALTDFLKILGPRAIDIANRGGRVAENTWYYFLFKWMNQYPEKAKEPEVKIMKTTVNKNFGDRILEWNQNQTPKSLVYHPGSFLGGTDISNKQKYKIGGTSKMDYEDPMQFGTRWSKAELYLALKEYHNNIHFHLDGMGDIYNILVKFGNYNYNVTSRELRFVFRFWQEFIGKVHFYNGYDQDFNVVEVECPWKDDGSFTLTRIFN